MILTAALLLLFCGVLASGWLLAARRRYAEQPFEVIFKLSQHSRTILGFQHRRDLTGAYAQLVLLLAGLAKLGDRKIYAPPIGEDYVLDGFECQQIDYSMVSSAQNGDDHMANNAASIQKLGLSGLCVHTLPGNVYKVDLDNWLSVTLAPYLGRPVLLDVANNTKVLQKIIVRGAGGMDAVFNGNVRSELYSGYIKQHFGADPPGRNDGRLKVCIHVRHGEVCDKPKRFIPSTEYVKLLSDLKEIVPDADIHLYSARWCDGDSQDVFRERGVTMHVDDVGVFETWEQFILADILVIARSSFSYVPALINNKGTVLYREFWHPALGDWIGWDATGILQKDRLRERVNRPHRN